MPEEKQVAHINGRYAIIIALISLIGGYLLRAPVEKYILKSHCDIGGLWSDSDGYSECSINKIEGDFYIKMQYAATLSVNCTLSGKGRSDGDKGRFEGELRVDAGSKDTTILVSGIAKLQGCDGLGVTYFLNSDEKKLKPATFNFIREKSNNSINPGESDK